LLYDFCLQSESTCQQDCTETPAVDGEKSRPTTMRHSGVEVGHFTGLQELPELVSLPLGRHRSRASFCHGCSVDGSLYRGFNNRSPRCERRWLSCLERIAPPPPRGAELPMSLIRSLPGKFGGRRFQDFTSRHLDPCSPMPTYLPTWYIGAYIHTPTRLRQPAWDG
jgi:hypothetical protein